MSKAKHTRGPWHQSTELTQIEGLDGTIVCHVSGAPSNESVIADARLIAAAPELLEALEWITRQHDEGQIIAGRSIEVARAAIAKATGEQK